MINSQTKPDSKILRADVSLADHCCIDLRLQPGGELATRLQGQILEAAWPATLRCMNGRPMAPAIFPGGALPKSECERV